MAKTIPDHLKAAGFVETSPGYFERGGAVVRFTDLTGAHVFTIGHPLNPSFDTAKPGVALNLARLLGDLGELQSTILSDAMASVAFHLTGQLRGLDLNAVTFPPHAQRELELAAARLALLIVSEALRVGAIPDDPPEDD